MIGIVDYNMGNLGSVMNAFIKVGAKAELVSDPDKLADYDRVTLPGVGAFPDAMRHLHGNGMSEAIQAFAKTGKPLMGTCLGMQLLFESSEEFGEHAGLELIPGKVVAFDEQKFDHKRKVPHMGWNELFLQKRIEDGGLRMEDDLHYLQVCHKSSTSTSSTLSTQYVMIAMP